MKMVLMTAVHFAVWQGAKLVKQVLGGRVGVSGFVGLRAKPKFAISWK